MPDLFDLAAKIKVDTSQSDRALNDTQKKVIQLTKEFERLDKTIKKPAGGDPLADLKAEFGARASRLRSDIASLQSGIGQIGVSAASATGPLVGLTVALLANVVAVGKLHKEMFDLAVSTAEAGAKAVDLSRKYGVTVEAIGAAEIVAAKTGKTLNDVITENRSQLDGWAAGFAKAGMIMDTETARAAKKLNNELIDLQFQWRQLGVEMGKAITPQVARLVDQLSDALRNNRGAVNALAGAVSVLAFYLGTNLVAAIGIAIAQLMILESHLRPLIVLSEVIGGLFGKMGNIPAQSTAMPEDLVGGSVGDAVDIAFMMRGAKRGGGGRRRGGGGARTDPGLALVSQLQDQLRDLFPRTELQIVQQKLLGAEYAKTTDKIKARAMAIAVEIDQIKKNFSVWRYRLETMREEREEFQRMVDLVREAGEAGVPGYTRPRMFGTRPRVVSPAALDYTFSLGEGSTFTQGGTGAGRPRVATAELTLLRAQMAEVRLQAASLASDITYSISNALRSGFEEGIKAGLLTFAQGILQIIEGAALRALEARLAAVFENVLGGGGGGGGFLGFLKGILPFIGAAAGGAARPSLPTGSFGGLGSIPLRGFASGGFLGAGQWGVVGEHGPELVRAGNSGATVSPGGNTVINFYVQNPAQLGSRETQAQVARMFTRMQQKRALTG